MKHLLLLIATFFMFNISISSPSSANEDQATTSTYEVKADKALSGLSLNNGKKWQMDEHTRKSFSEMEKLFLYVNPKDSSDDELKKYGADLRTGIDTLIKGCKMQGDAHDQLHTFIMPYIDIVDNLSQNGKKSEAIKIQRYLKTYREFFE